MIVTSSKAQPYREIAEMIPELPPVRTVEDPTFEVRAFQNDIMPDCPKCSGYVRGVGSVCCGRRSFFGSKSLCPQKATHFHVKCGTCGYRWLMATKDVARGVYG